jgi:hypothetical protein
MELVGLAYVILVVVILIILYRPRGGDGERIREGDPDSDLPPVRGRIR